MFCTFFYAIQDFQEFFQSEDLLQAFFNLRVYKKVTKVSSLTFISGVGVEREKIKVFFNSAVRMCGL